MSNRIVVDPITRIEGHLRIEAEIKDGKIVNAYSAGTMVRGIELILKAAIRVMRGRSRNGCAACARRFTRLHRSAPLKIR